MQSEQFDVRIYEKLEEVPWKDWDLVCTSNFLHSSSFLKVLKDADVESSEYLYVMIYRGEELQATAILSVFRINLDIFVDSEKLVNVVRKIWKGWLKIDALICGTPISLGQSGVVIKEEVSPESIYVILATEMNRIAKKRHLKYLAVKEFKQNQSSGTQVFEKKGFFKANSLPNMEMEISWNTFSDYVQQLKQGYRRQLRLSLKKVGLDLDLNSISKDTFTDLGITDVPNVSPQEFHQMYLSVMSRAESKLETLNLAFFEQLFALKHRDLRYAHLKVEGQIQGVALLFRENDVLTFALVGKHVERDAYDTYFNLITVIVKYAIENGFKKLILGQTSYYPKSKVGGLPVDQFFYFRSSNPILHLLLKTSKNLLFPMSDVRILNVFK